MEQKVGRELRSLNAINGDLGLTLLSNDQILLLGSIEFHPPRRNTVGLQAGQVSVREIGLNSVCNPKIGFPESAPVKSARLIFAYSRLASRKCAPLRSTPKRAAPLKSAPPRSASLRVAPTR